MIVQVFWILFSAQVVRRDVVESLTSGDNFTSTQTSSLLIDIAQPSKAVLQQYDNEDFNNNMTKLKFQKMSQWEAPKLTLEFPKSTIGNNYKMSILLNDKYGIFKFQFLHEFLKLLQPYNLPLELIRDIMENRITTSKLIAESMHMEVGLLVLVGVCCILACVIPGTEIWLACRPIREDYKPSQHPKFLALLLYICVLLLGLGIATVVVCNEVANTGVKQIPLTIDTAIQDLSDYHTGTTVQLRKCLTRSLDVASEAMMADLDNIEELLGKPVQRDLVAETGVDAELDRLLEIANESQEYAAHADDLLSVADRIRELGVELSRDIERLRRDLEAALTSARCNLPQDRLLCATINPSDLAIQLNIQQLLRDERLQRLRNISRDNLTEAGRQARGEYLYVPHHVARSTLDTRNRIRREINAARAKIFEETRDLETSNTEVTRQLDSLREIINHIVPYISDFEEIRWLVSIGAACAILLVWFLLFCALLCRCGSNERKIRPTLLCAVFTSCLISICLWLVLMGSLAVSTHTEMLVCKPLEDPNYRALEVILESKMFLGKPLNPPLNELLEKCEQNEAIYPSFTINKMSKFDEIADYWTWSDLTKSLEMLKVDLKGLKIFPTSLEAKLEGLLYACGPNLPDHRTMIRGPILTKDLIAMSDQVYNVARHLTDTRSSRELESIASAMRSLMNQRVRPLINLQNDLVDKLTTLEIQLKPYQQRVNTTLLHLKNIQYQMDVESEVLAQMKTKSYVDRLGNYLDQWRTHVLMEMRSEVTRCRPLWDIVGGLKLNVCDHILGPLDGLWFTIFLCTLVMMISTPIAHTLAAVYRDDLEKIIVFTPSTRQGSPETLVIDRETWQTPAPPPRQESW